MTHTETTKIFLVGKGPTGYGCRIWIPKFLWNLYRLEQHSKKCNTDILGALNLLCCWGGADKDDQDCISWEFEKGAKFQAACELIKESFEESDIVYD